MLCDSSCTHLATRDELLLTVCLASGRLFTRITPATLDNPSSVVLHVSMVYASARVVLLGENCANIFCNASRSGFASNLLHAVVRLSQPQHQQARLRLVNHFDHLTLSSSPLLLQLADEECAAIHMHWKSQSEVNAVVDKREAVSKWHQSGKSS